MGSVQEQANTPAGRPVKPLTGALDSGSASMTFEDLSVASAPTANSARGNEKIGSASVRADTEIVRIPSYSRSIGNTPMGWVWVVGPADTPKSASISD